MNKKFSTLMLGMLLTSAFASADNVVTANVQKAAKWESGKSYFVVADNQSQGNAGAFDTKDAFLSVSKNGEDYSFKSVKKGVDVKYLTWTFQEENISGQYYYSLKNEEYGIYLSVKDDGTVYGTDKKDDAYFVTKHDASGNVDATVRFSSPGYLYPVNATDQVLIVGTSQNGTVTVGGGAPAKILLCEYKENSLSGITGAETLNDVKGGEGFNLKFSAGNTYEWANDVLTDVNLKAFYVHEESSVNDIEIDGVNDLNIPAGIYFASEYPASLSGTNEITSATDFKACTFVAVDPDSNYGINASDRSKGYGFELTTVAGSEMIFYTGNDEESSNASKKGEVYVGNACFTVSEPDPLRAEGEYKFSLSDLRYLADATKDTHVSSSEDLEFYVGVVTDRSENFLVTVNPDNTNTGKVLAFTTTNSTLYDVTKLLKSEDAPSIYTMQFVSEVNKENAANEKGQYLTVGYQSGLVLSAVEDINAEDPLFQFVITSIDADNNKVTFANRQADKNFEAQLYENEDGSFTVYASNDLFISTVDEDNTENGVVTFKQGSLLNTKVILTEVNVEDKFATFVNRSEGAGLVTFELAKNIDDTPAYYVGIEKDQDDEPDYKDGKLFAYSDEAAQFELIKNEVDKDDEPQYILNKYVYLKNDRTVTSTEKDTVAYYTYKIKVFTADNQDAYVTWTSGTGFNLTGTKSSALNFAIKNNVDGSVSLIDLGSATLKTVKNKGNNYLIVNSDVKDENPAWTGTEYYSLKDQLSSDGLKTFMVEENPAVSYEAVPQHVSFEAVRGGFLTKDENNDARLAITNTAAEDLTFWLDTVHSDKNIPSFYILKNGSFMYNAADSAKTYSAKDNYRFNLDNKPGSTAKLIFKAGELVTSDTLRTMVDGQSVLVAEEDNAPKKIKGGLKNFQFQIIQAEEGSDEYVIRDHNYQYVCQKNNYFYMSRDKDAAYRFVIEKQAAPTANEGIEVSEVKVIAGNGQITIMGAAGKKVVVSNILGKVVASQTISSDNATIAVPSGIVAVAVEGEAAVKAVVK